jgi:hypothetical protein
MAAVQFGEDVGAGAAISITLPNATNYYLESVTENEAILDEETTTDADGKPVNIIQFFNIPVVTANLVCKAAGAPATDFPVGSVITIGSDKWKIASAPVTKSKSPHKVSVRLEKWNLAP